jgi:hypothetical protein
MARQAGQTIDQAIAKAIVPGVIAAAGDRDRVLYEPGGPAVYWSDASPAPGRAPARWAGLRLSRMCRAAYCSRGTSAKRLPSGSSNSDHQPNGCRAGGWGNWTPPAVSSW